MKSRIFITGGGGLLAYNWAVAARQHFSVTLGLHTKSIVIEFVDPIFLPLYSLTDVLNTIREIGAELVIHSAAMTNVEACEFSPPEAYNCNVDISINVAEACIISRSKLVHTSTDHLFSGRYAMSTEQSPVSPINVYGETKAAGEIAVLKACPSALVIRTNFLGGDLPIAIHLVIKL